MKLLIIDNFDSFTYNLVQYLGELGAEQRVVRNNAIRLDEIEAYTLDAIVISPGPGTPDSAGISIELIRKFTSRFPILGVCLGHQAIAQAFGGKIVRAKELMHGKTSLIHHEKTGIFADLPNPFIATRYHSLVVDPSSLPDCLGITARTESGVIMSVAHKEHPVIGVQFHPESILTDCGKQLLKNFLKAIQ
ncbi:MAG: anthranilate synthase component II [bacterium]